jgi:hypothetical protein
MRCLFGKVLDEKVELNWCGRIVAEEWQKTSKLRQEIYQTKNPLILKYYFIQSDFLDKYGTSLQ